MHLREYRVVSSIIMHIAKIHVPQVAKIDIYDISVEFRTLTTNQIGTWSQSKRYYDLSPSGTMKVESLMDPINCWIRDALLDADIWLIGATRPEIAANGYFMGICTN
jgi:hypothetical protein